MNVSNMSNETLLALIHAASSELADRLAEPAVVRVQDTRPSRDTVVLRVPSDDDKDFILRLKSNVSSGAYATAAERSRVAALAEKYGAWIKRQGLPTDMGTWAWRKLAEQSRVKPATER